MPAFHFTQKMFVIAALCALFIVTAAGWVFTGYLVKMATRTVQNDVANANLIISLNLINELKKIESAAVAVSGSPLTLPVLQANTPENMGKINNILDRYHKSLDAAACYLIDKNGITLASSNRNEKDSFVGQNYTFRPYFQQAIQGGIGQHFAVGTVSGKRGFFASAPVRDKDGKIAGVVTIKKELEDIEIKLKQYLWFLVDQNGIIFISSQPEARLKSLWPLGSEQKQKIILSKQYGPGPFEPVLQKQVKAGADVRFKGGKYLAAQHDTPLKGVSVVLLWPTGQISMYRSFGIALTVLTNFLVISFLGVIYIFRKAIRQREHSEKELRAYTSQLERTSAIKTELAGINIELQQAKGPEEMAQKLVSHIAPLLGVHYGVFYLFDEERSILRPIGSYGYVAESGAVREFGIGQGLAGQCAKEKAPIILACPHESDIRIISGLVDASPREIVLQPVLHSGRLLGVIELAGLKALDPDKRALLEEIMPVVAVNLEIQKRYTCDQ